MRLLTVVACVVAAISLVALAYKMHKRSLSELINKDDPAWPLVQEWIKAAKNQVEVLPASDPTRAEALVATQVTTRSPMGAFYFAPDTLKWEDTDKGYSDFLFFCFNGDLETYYKDMRWTGWQAEVAKLTGDQGISIYPFLCAEGPAIGERHRGPVPMSELYGLFVESPPEPPDKKK